MQSFRQRLQNLYHFWLSTVKDYLIWAPAELALQ
jgi:hypothetical protein